MLLLWALPLGIVLGYLRGGRLANLSHLELQGAWLVLLALIIQLLIFPLGSRPPVVQFGTEVFHLLSYALLAAFVVLNRREWGILAMGLGMLLNVIAIAANGGYMPTYPELLIAAGRLEAAQRLQERGIYANNICIGCEGIDARLTFLGDVFYAPAWVPFANVFSIGDLLIATGLIYFLQAKMRSP
jgi:hypothetical protein